jgi:hypothetical protein
MKKINLTRDSLYKMKKYKFFLIISTIIISLLTLSCKKFNFENETKMSVYDSTKDSLSAIATLNKKITLRDEFKSHKSNNKDLPLNDINNVTILNGFKNVKLGSKLNIYSFENYPKDNIYLSYEFSKIYDYFNDSEIKVGNGYIASAKVEYINNNLVYIELTHFEKVINTFDINKQNFDTDFRQHSLLNLYTRIFGTPTKAMLFDNNTFFTYPFKECFQEDYESCFTEFCNLSEQLRMMESIAVSFIWTTESTTYELIITADSKISDSKNEEDKKRKSYENGNSYYSSEKSLIRIYSSKQNLLQNLKSLEQESFNIKHEQEKDSKAKTDFNGI